MKLKKIIRKILQEEFNPRNYILRRMDKHELEGELEYALDYLSKGFKKIERMRKEMSYETFSNIVISMILTPLEQELLENNQYELIKELNIFLYKIYKDKIKERYEELTGRQLKENVLYENDKNKHKLVRRLTQIDKLVSYGMSRPFSLTKPCDFKTSEDYIDSFGDWLCENMYYSNFNNLDDTGEEWGEIYHLMKEYIEVKHGEDLKQYFEDEC